MNVFTGMGHLSDEAMLLLHQSELGKRDCRRAQAHLQGCAACRMRNESLLREEDDLQLLSSKALPDSSARARLQKQMAVDALRQHSSWGQFGQPFAALLRPRALLHAGLLLILGVSAVVLWHAGVSASSSAVRYGALAGPRPNPKLTPGATDPVELAALCGRSDSNLDPQLPREKIQAVFRAYGLSDRAAADYQVDYLINPQLGGNDHLANLWPEPYTATVWSASAKDELERQLHWMVCSGQVDLAAAQHDLASDWIGAYQKYLNASGPSKVMAWAKAPADRNR